MTSPGDVLVADVVVIGSGVSGLTTALSLEGRDVVVLTKGPLAS
ncbi:MAG: FAD-dependent oxidoreductase, partial [Actinobacteria bacterium]|nr:FAD-dependent oxidoreductase [Actinomycetota bacterium]NIS28728.1 FAD-dependent oxidoreductase [Actinomycetota bacterium]NIT94116.1 FAD-dependent oxidoreductase [Actinomycetota bacterium]NIU17744.1 FAD-dependent oxidoreductase [Actinomycetota bacterium]NIU64190.1 FAD-dependent oxidoreductase [Actinomycetota bacterium]